ncbi:trichohyalin-like isoform X3 [Papaver somniferum]|uniref:trichohyalin-like isoform X3 n=1 Tax=Papaver somniferum TaxID=3469 RepID=UPI000E6F5B5C|nr:trichohyalin-like isoform X3 [Papaver somniferum]XP_026436080.1 trichohyalin-like isoform X3 [Papaver somniferum]
MKTRKMAAAAQQEACRYRGNICKILSGDNHLQFCDKHYKFHTDFLRNNPSILKKWHHDLLGSDSTPDLTKKKKRKQAPDQQRSILPPDEERCCRNDGMIWRCKNFRMKTKSYCQQHCTSIFLHNKNRLMKKKKNKKNSGSDFSKKKRNSGSDSNCTKRPGKRQLTDQPSTSNPSTSSDGIVGAGSVKIGAKRKRVERMSGELKSFTGIRETRASKRRKMLMEGGETSNQPATNDNFESDGIVGGASAEIGAKRKRLEKMSGEPKSLTGIRETRASKRWKMLMEGGETSNQPAANDNFESDAIVGGASAEIGSKGKNVERTKGSGEPVIELESVNLYKSNCFELSMEPEKNKVELEKNQVELEKNQVELEKNEVEIEKKKVELEKNKMEPEKVEAELEKNEVELETNEVEIEKKKVELEKNKMEPEKNKMEPEKVKAELEKNEVELETNEVELEKKKVELEKNKMEPEKNKVELEKNEVELETNAVELEMNAVELGKKKLELEKNKMEPEKNKAELEKNEVELEKNEVEREENEVEREKNKVELEKNEVELEKNEVEREKNKMEPEKNKMELEKHEVELEKKKVELEKNKMELEKNEVELETNEVELEKKKVELEKNKMEPEKNKMEPEKVKAELEKNEVELEKKKVELEKNKMEPEMNKVELEKPEKNKVELEKVKAELEKNEVELETNAVELGKKKVEVEKNKMEPEKNKVELEKNEVELEKNEVEREKNKMEPEKNKLELEKHEVELEKNKMELEKNKVDPEKMKVELEKKKVECTEFQDKLAEVEETRKSTSKDENATELWRMKCSNSEILVQRMENENSTIGCVETRISNLVSLVPGNGKESSILRCQELSYSEKIESEARGLQNEITQTGEKQRDENMSKPNAETRGEGSKDSRAYELKAEEKVLNVEEGKGWGCLEERPSQHGSSSQADLEMCKKTFVNLVSDSIDGGDSLGAEDSLGDSMDMLAMKNLNMNKDKMKWNSEADMLSSVEEDPEFCMKAVGALYQQEIPEDEIYPKGLVD